MAIRCPACGRRVARKQIDVAADRVACRHCGKVASYRAITGVHVALAAGRVGGPAGTDVQPGAPARAPGPPSLPRPGVRPRPAATQGFDPANPPRGAWFRDDGVTMTVGGHTRSIGGGVFLLLLAAFWWSVNAMFLFGSLITIVKGLGLSTGQVGFGSLAGGVFMLFVSLLFALGGWFIVSQALMLIAGRVEFTLRGDELRAFSGVWFLGRRHVFSAAAVASIEEDVRVIRTSRSSTTQRTILVKHPPGRDVRVGPMLNDPRRRFVLGVLKQIVGR